MGTKKSLVVLLIIFSSINCSKENENVLSGTYVTGGMASPGPIYMYTRNGQITDTGFIRQYLSMQNNADSFYVFGNGSVTKPAELMRLNINGSGSILVTRKYAIQQIIECHIETNSSSMMVIAKNDSSEVFFSSGPLNPLISRCDTLGYDFGLVKSPRVFYLLDPISGGGILKWVYKFPILKVDGTLKLPIVTLSTKSVKATGHSCWVTTSGDGFMQVFDKGILERMQLGDTIVYQIKYLPFFKQ